MKKIIAYFSIILVVILGVNIIHILTTEFDRLTEYGFGYLTGKIILFMIFLSLIYITRGAFQKEKLEAN